MPTHVPDQIIAKVEVNNGKRDRSPDLGLVVAGTTGVWTDQLSVAAASILLITFYMPCVGSRGSNQR